MGSPRTPDRADLRALAGPGPTAPSPRCRYRTTSPGGPCAASRERREIQIAGGTAAAAAMEGVGLVQRE